MQLSRALEQHIAVFGESGSGKTVLVSSFYGATQEPQFLKSSPFHVVAESTSDGNRLHKNYLGMQNSARRPEPTRFSSTSYAFSIRMRDSAQPSKARPFDALRLVWHDYPGEWFEEDVSGAEIAARRVETFRSLLGSDVALLLVDGQKLLDNAGEEERYLKSLLGNFRNGVLSLKEQLLQDGKPLVKFPRIWVLALSKADLLPEVDVFKFRDLIIEKASDDVDELSKVLKGFVESSDAFAVGEDFLLLSSARFGDKRIDVQQRIGVDLALPIAAMLPFERHVRWVAEKRVAARVAEELLGGAAALAAVLVGKSKFGGRVGRLMEAVGREAVTDAMRSAVKLAGARLREKNSEARERSDHMAAALTQFRLDLDEAEEKRTLFRSLR